jgi:hypothetical protein
MHFASPSINPALYPRIVAVVMFGDPGNRGPNTTFPIGYGGITPVFPDALAQKLKENCAVGDPVRLERFFISYTPFMFKPLIAASGLHK